MPRYSARQSPVKPSMTWNPSTGTYMCKFDINTKDTDEGTAAEGRDFKDQLKDMCDYGARWDGINKAWHVQEADYDNIKTLFEAKFGTFELFEKPDTVKSGPDLTHLNGAAKAALTMFTIAGYDNARTVYSHLVKAFHPDKVNHMDISDEDKAALISKASEITTSWRELKQYMGW